MEIKVKSLDSVPEKSTQEVEETLLKKHEEENDDKSTDVVEEQPVEQVAEDSAVESPTLKDEDVLSYIKNRYDKDISSVDDLFSEREQSDNLPEEVSKYLDYKKNTGRGFEDFVKVNKQYDNLDDDQVLAEYYSLTESDLDKEDIHYLMEEKFSYDEDIDDEKDIKKKNIAKKRELSKAKTYLNELKEKYRIPLESSGNSISEEQIKEIEAYKSYIKNSQSANEIAQKKNEFFVKRTNEVFNPEFKGFEFEIGDKKVKYSYGDVNEMKSKQSDLNNLVKKYVGDDGLINDATGWHRALSAAMDPQRFASYFYEQGKADAIGDVTKKSKNVNMSIRQTPQSIGDTGFKARQVSDTSGRGLRIKSKKK
mgnify:FL=1|tara:strand:+ start:19754 stop:20851 length:1098 start_codon:yes stop_codon:yes gene_type:complete